MGYVAAFPFSSFMIRTLPLTPDPHAYIFCTFDDAAELFHATVPSVEDAVSVAPEEIERRGLLNVLPGVTHAGQPEAPFV
jgi:hypothetical protein